jgi:histone H3/H4
MNARLNLQRHFETFMQQQVISHAINSLDMLKRKTLSTGPLELALRNKSQKIRDILLDPSVKFKFKKDEKGKEKITGFAPTVFKRPGSKGETEHLPKANLKRLMLQCGSYRQSGQSYVYCRKLIFLFIREVLRCAIESSDCRSQTIYEKDTKGKTKIITDKNGKKSKKAVGKTIPLITSLDINTAVEVAFEVNSISAFSECAPKKKLIDMANKPSKIILAPPNKKNGKGQPKKK